MFERTLQDLIRGLRAHKASSKAQEDAFLAEAIAEIREELRGKDMALKAEGILKTCYLMMLYPIPPPAGFAFHVVEVMSSPRFHLKQLGYMAAPMAFSGETEEVVLTVNGIKKDLMSPHIALPPLPLTALPHLLSLSSSLSHTLHSDLLNLLTHSSPRIRKRAVLCLLPCWEAFPEGLREGFPRLRERLSDEDSGVQGATVGVVMELARRQGGKNYLPLAPELFAILTQSSNNWMLIKVVKLPRLVRKLLPPITNLISSTSAISLLYECTRTCIVGGMLDPDRPEGEALARVCVEKLGGYLRDEGGDQNRRPPDGPADTVRYIALLAMVKIIPTHPAMVAEYQDEILQSLDDPDVSIRMRALDLVTSMVDSSSLQHIADQLLAHLAPAPPALPSAVSSLRAISTDAPKETAAAVTSSPSYRLLVAQKLLSIINHDTYVHVTDFSWVISILVDVSLVSHVPIGEVVREMLLDVVGRVKSVREHAVKVLERILADDGVREHARDAPGNGEEGVVEAALWICGEYPGHLASPLSAINNILTPSLALHSASTISLSLQSTAKIFAHHCSVASSSYTTETHQTTVALASSIQSGIAPFTSHPDIEVSERANEFSQLLSFVAADLTTYQPAKHGDPELRGGFEDTSPDYPKSLFLFPPLFSAYPLNALGAQAQAAVPLPDGFDIDREIVPGGGWLGENLVVEEESEEEGDDLGEGGGAGMDELRRVLREQDGKVRGSGKGKGKGKKKEDMTEEELAERAKRKAARKARQNDNPFYLDTKEEDVDEIPIVKLDLGDNDGDLDGASSTGRAPPAETRGKPPMAVQRVEIDRTGELPPGATAPSSAAVGEESKAAGGLAGVDLVDPGHTERVGSTGRFQEYDLDEKEKDIQADADVPAAPEVEVVRVKRKKKKRAVE